MGEGEREGEREAAVVVRAGREGRVGGSASHGGTGSRSRQAGGRSDQRRGGMRGKEGFPASASLPRPSTHPSIARPGAGWLAGWLAAMMSWPHDACPATLRACLLARLPVCVPACPALAQTGGHANRKVRVCVCHTHPLRFTHTHTLAHPHSQFRAHLHSCLPHLLTHSPTHPPPLGLLVPSVAPALACPPARPTPRFGPSPPARPHSAPWLQTLATPHQPTPAHARPRPRPRPSHPMAGPRRCEAMLVASVERIDPPCSSSSFLVQGQATRLPCTSPPPAALCPMVFAAASSRLRVAAAACLRNCDIFFSCCRSLAAVT